MHADVLPRRHGDTEKNKIWGVLLSNARKPENSAITASNLAKIVWEQGIASTNHSGQSPDQRICIPCSDGWQLTTGTGNCFPPRALAAGCWELLLNFQRQGPKSLCGNSILQVPERANNPKGVTRYSPALPALGIVENDRSPVRDDAI